jgi:hypothetical protein
MSILLALALQTVPAVGADFHARVRQAKLAEGAAAGPDYQKKMWDRIGNATTDAYKACLASNTPADKSPFTLVANVGADGHLADIAVQPATPRQPPTRSRSISASRTRPPGRWPPARNHGQDGRIGLPYVSLRAVTGLQ